MYKAAIPENYTEGLKVVLNLSKHRELRDITITFFLSIFGT